MRLMENSMNNNDEKTISAISTAYGEGGIGIVRMSGAESFRILCKIFRTPFKDGDNSDFDNSIKLDEIKNRHLYYGNVVDPVSKRIVDEVLVVFMKGPATYTKEDVCEIYCHGSVVSLGRILELTFDMGAVPASPGEFTKRAFLNGRIDLSQAEAVIDIIKAKSDVGFELAIDQLEGSVSKKISQLTDQILNVVATIVVDIDYPDEDAADVKAIELREQLLNIKEQIDGLVKTADSGRMIKDGINTVIAGKPNVGKSSLMNELLREARSIVTEIPGTTRDTIEEVVNLNGIPVKLTDTAGIRDTDDKIEKIGIQKTKEAFNNADLIIFMLDGQSGIDDLDRDIGSKIGERKCFAVINKTDLGRNMSDNQIHELVPEATIIEMSVVNGLGLEKVEQGITELVFAGELKQENSLVVTGARHKNLLKQASKEMEEAMNMIDIGEALDFVHVNVNQALEYLGEITGESVTEDILHKVFSQFCVGK